MIIVSPADADEIGVDERAFALYRDGRVLDALALLSDESDKTMPAVEQVRRLELILDLCAAARLPHCLSLHGRTLAQLLEENKIEDPRIARKLGYVWALERSILRDVGSIAEHYPDDFAVRLGDPLTDPATYVGLQLVAADVQRRQRKFQESQVSLSRAFAVMLDLPFSARWLVAKSLLRTIRQQIHNGDIVKARTWFAIADPLFTTSFAVTSPDHAEYLELRADILAYGGINPQLADAMREAADAVGRLQIEAEERDSRTSALLAHVAAVKVLTGDFAGAREALSKHPSAKRREHLIAAGGFNNWEDFVYAVAEVFVAAASGDTPEERWIASFEASPEWAQPAAFRALVEGYRGLARTLLLAKQEPKAAGQILRLSMDQNLAQVSEDLTEAWEAFQLPADIDTVMLGLLVPALTPSASSNSADADLLLRAMEYLARSPQTADADALAVVAAQPDEDSRRLAHSALRLTSQQSYWERRQLEALVVRMMKPAPTDSTRWERRHGLQLARLVHERRRVSEVLDRRGMLRAVKGRLPSLAELQRALTEDEAYLTHVATIGGLAKLCVRQHSVASTIEPYDPRQVQSDVRLLIAALSAGHAPSDELDRQYPAQAAMRIQQLLFGGLQECLRSGSHVIYAPLPDFSGLPLAALLREVPPKHGEGYDLSKAAWLGREFSFSYVRSARGFLAARSAASKAGGDLTFLGLGDPILSTAPSTDTSTQSATGGESREFAGELFDLPELPETRTELLRVSGVLDADDAVLLLGDQASEEQFRRQPLSRFNIIQFATHGLVRADLTGLAEAALVLTPNPVGDTFDDGLLTAQELASLELRARLVVLSACNTANFDPSIFAGQIQGLTSALTLSGVPTVIASLWSVDSRISEALMVRFFEELMRGKNTGASSAFATAMNRTIDAATSSAFQHPRFWAPFIVMGDGATIPFGPQQHEAGMSWVSGPPVTGGGEILSVAADQAGANFFASLIGPSRGDRHSAVIQRRAENGQVLWVNESQTLGAGPISAGNELVFTGGYAAGEPASAVVRAFSKDGRLKWVRAFDVGAEFETISAIAAVADGVVAVIAGTNFKAGLPRPDDMTLVRLDGSGVESTRLSIVSENAQGFGLPLAAAIGAADDRIVLALNQEGQFTNWDGSVDDFHVPRMCQSGFQSRVVVLDSRSLAQLQNRDFANLSVSSIAVAGGEILVAGTMHEECGLAQTAFAGRLSDSLDLETIWQNDTAFDSQARGIVKISGKYYIVGQVRRTVALGVAENDLNTTASEVAAAVSVDRRLPSELTERHEAFVVSLTRKGVAIKRHVDTGVSTFLLGLVPGHRGIVAFGSVGFSPLWLWTPLP